MVVESGRSTGGTGGAIDGSGAANRVAVWSDADTLTGSGELTFDGAELAAHNTAAALDANFHTYGTSIATSMRLRRARGTQAAPTAVGSGDQLGAHVLVGHDGTDWAIGAQLDAIAAEAWTAAARGAYMRLLITQAASATTRQVATWYEKHFAFDRPIVAGSDANPPVNVCLYARKTQRAAGGAAQTTALMLEPMTTAERDGMTATNGMLIYNSTTAQFEKYQAGAWVAM